VAKTIAQPWPPVYGNNAAVSCADTVYESCHV